MRKTNATNGKKIKVKRLMAFGWNVACVRHVEQHLIKMSVCQRLKKLISVLCKWYRIWIGTEIWLNRLLPEAVCEIASTLNITKIHKHARIHAQRLVPFSVNGNSGENFVSMHELNDSELKTMNVEYVPRNKTKTKTQAIFT